MSREKLIIFGAVLLGLMGILVYKQAKKDEALGHPAASAMEFPSLGVPSDVDKISVTNGDKPEVTLELVADSKPAAAAPDAGSAAKWLVTKPLRADANQQAAKDLAANLLELKIASNIQLRLDEETRKDKQLDPAHAVHIVAYKGGEKKFDALFGKSGAAGQLMVLADKPTEVWAVKGYSSYLYTKEPKDFRNKEIFHFDDDKVFQVAITNLHGTVTFTKSGDGKWAAMGEKKPIERFDQEKVKDLIRAFKVISAEDFGDGKSQAETGLDTPAAHVVFHLTGESATPEMYVGKTATGTTRYARITDNDTTYTITGYAADWLVSDVSKFQSPADAGAADSGAKAAKKK
jgi:hypothetical protein